jgi:hemerythrin superfamily protein
MPDITDVILDEHETFRRRFAELDDKRADAAPAADLEQVWRPLADLLERHAAAEEELFYPRLLARGENANDETRDALSDHNDIRAAVARAQALTPGSDDWWTAVIDARNSNSDHMAEEEREAFPDFREHVARDERDRLGGDWLDFTQRHAGARGLDLDQRDVDRYLRRHG